MLLKLALPPGLSKDGTEYQSEGRWSDTSLVRWIGTAAGPIGGWQPHTKHALTGFCRSLLPWRALGGGRHLIGTTEEGVFHVGATGVVADLTPTGFTTGNPNSLGGSGYGGGSYGSGAYGVARPDEGVTTEASVFVQDTFGQVWLGCMEGDGHIYEWTPANTAVKAAAVTNAPTSCTGVFVTEQRAVVALGASGDGRTVAWSDLEDRNDWSPTTENQAGDFTLNTEGTIVTGLRIGSQNLIITDVDATMMVYEGLPFVYGFQRVGSTGCGAMSKGSVVNMGQQAVWWGRSGFWMFNGGAVTPIACDIEAFLRINLNKTQRAKVSGWHNADFHEVWWLYPSVNSLECDSYVFWDYVANIWGRGALNRTCGAAKGVFEYPLLSGSDSIIYEHETGLNYDDQPIFIESGPIELGNGDQIMKVYEVIGDETAAGQAQVGFSVQAFPNAPAYDIAPVVLSGSGKTDVRFCGRQVRMTVTFLNISSNSRFGTARLNAQSGGRR